MKRVTPRFSRILGCFERNVESYLPGVSGVQEHLVSEARDLLREFDPLLAEIEALNTTLTEESEQQMPQFDELLSLLRQCAETDQDLADWFEKNPNPRVVGKASGVNIPLGKRDPSDDADGSAERNLRRLTEVFYRNAHRLLQVLKQLPDLSKIECREISIVRNQLLEHPEGQGAPITLPSFGYGTAGPRIKPIQATDQAGVHQDRGLFHNAAELHEALRIALCTS